MPSPGNTSKPSTLCVLSRLRWAHGEGQSLWNIQYSLALAPAVSPRMCGHRIQSQLEAADTFLKFDIESSTPALYDRYQVMWELYGGGR